MTPLILNSMEDNCNPAAAHLVVSLKEYARNLYETRQLLCSEAVLVALNKGLNGGLTEEQAVAMAAPFCVAMGDSGCLCGALSGAVLGAGLFIGNSRPYSHRREMRKSGLALHNAFKAANGATCCRVLSRKVKHDKKAHFKQCAGLTADATEMAALLILDKRPELLQAFDSPVTLKKHGRLGGMMAYLSRWF
ncbi:C_GCAxxG_C_C family probable redox protein [Desulfocicer vacuolatum DSM 3385]|uniref:C_GCAxxG_C_C family probable redox protein n=1 Tax=Desulfocicer vacuolatum DSM 3385 TaxID=1121400 RepID=A0A1W2A7K0_9BACT|nr:C-GCAxxG-C-C family protein [Desulfocicer vacuolatum]SMC56442.1 C_GCAxxG_C_C family probable redox protein [Desulfocicer vacuolatum DSM 3385]